MDDPVSRPLLLTMNSPHYQVAVSLVSRFSELKGEMVALNREAAAVQKKIKAAADEREAIWAALTLLGVPDEKRGSLEEYDRLLDPCWVSFEICAADGETGSVVEVST